MRQRSMLSGLAALVILVLAAGAAPAAMQEGSSMHGGPAMHPSRAAPGSSMSRTISVFINDQPQHYPVSPMMSAGRVLVPMRETFQSLGAKVTWDARARKVTATREGTEVILKLGDRRAMVGGKPMMLDAPPQMRQGHVFVPLRFVGECVGARVAWDARAYRVMIATRPPAAMPAPAVAAPAAPAATAAAAPPAASTTAALPSPAEAPAASGAEAAAATEPAATELATMLTREQRVRVKLTDYHIACQPEKAVAGPVIFYVSNDGPSPHALAIDGMKDRTPNLKAGEKTKLKVELEPGTYTLYCPIGAHRILGMKTRFVVESP